MIPKITHSKWNHSGITSGKLVATVTMDHEVALDINDILSMLGESSSDSISRLINHIGKTRHPMDLAVAMTELDEHGSELVKDMYWHLTNGDAA